VHLFKVNRFFGLPFQKKMNLRQIGENEARQAFGMLAFDIVAKGYAELGESPVWDAKGNCIWWVDVEGRKLFCTAFEDRSTKIWKMPERTGFVVLRAPGLPALGMETGIYAFDPDDGALERLVALDAPGKRFNDATVDPFGRLWVTIMSSDVTPNAASVCRITPKLTIETIFDKMTTPNGLAIDGERGLLYFSDSHPDRRSIWTANCNLMTGVAGGRALFADTENLGGRPDGAAIDRQGRYWIAALDDKALYVFSPAGEFLKRVSVPFDSPTKLTFAGADGSIVVVTSKAIGAHGGSLAIGASEDKSANGEPMPFWQYGKI
jgi:D-xylonolactonase